VALAPAREIAQQMAEAICTDFGSRRGACLLLLNGFGGTPSMELYLMYDNLRTVIEKQGFAIARSLVGNYVTSLEMAGCSATIALLDDESMRLWDAPVHTPALRWGT
jgi:dihydroxyacetone kinase-like protein